MQRMTARTRRIAIAGAVMAMAAAAFDIAGSAIVLDSGGKLASVAVIDGSGVIQPLNRLPGQLFFAVPQIEGEFEFHCRNGSRERSYYITPRAHIWLKIEPGSTCDKKAIR